MTNFMDYLDWRGDLTFEEAPFNEVDALLLSYLSYVNFDKVLPDWKRADAAPAISLRKAREAFFTMHKLEDFRKDRSFIRQAPNLMEKIGKTRTFGDIALSCYVDHVDLHEEEQFAALCMDLGKGRHRETPEDGAKEMRFVSFRGTDDTIIGWKEDFNMCFTGEVPAQRKALEYLEKAAANTKGNLVVCGHSKGGNLAVYSSCKAKSSVRKRVKDIYNFDGPGFGDRTDLGVGKEETFKKVHSFVPEQSIVGMLLDHDTNYTVVRSDGEFIFQHDAGTWQVKGTHFETLEKVDKYSAALDDTIKNWILALSEEERAEFVNVLFGVVFATSSRTLEDINADVFSFATETLKTYSGLPKETRNMVKKIVSMFFKSGSETLKRNAKLGAIEKKEKMTLAKAITKKAVK